MQRLEYFDREKKEKGEIRDPRREKRGDGTNEFAENLDLGKWRHGK
jgi:hypothetical protein